MRRESWGDFFFRIQKLIFSLNFLFLVSTKLSQNISGYGFFSLLFLHILYTMDFYFFFFLRWFFLFCSWSSYFFSQLRKFLRKEGFQSLCWLHDRGIGLVEKPAVFKDSHDITDEFAQFGVLAIVYFLLDTRQICEAEQKVSWVKKNLCGKKGRSYPLVLWSLCNSLELR